MSGRKHHFIQQHLSRGFAIDPSRRPAQVWVYRKNTVPFRTSTEGYGAQRDFYGSPENATVDDEITQRENALFDPLLLTLRSCQNGDSVDPNEASEYYSHLISRSKHIRDVFTDGIKKMLQSFFDDLINHINWDAFCEELLLKNTDQLVGMAELKFGRVFTKEERVWAKEGLLRDGKTIARQVAGNVGPLICLFRDGFNSRVDELMGAAHLNALQKSFSTSDGKREVEMRQLHWRVLDVESPLVLGDSCVYAQLTDGRFVPFTDASMVALNLFLPVSSHRFLVGNKDGEKPDIRHQEMNHAAIACSFESFCFSKDLPELRALQKNIGLSAMPMTDDELRENAKESIKQSLAEQIKKGFAD